jgi:SPP1 family predicted phage head-tail adaptor
MKQKLQQFPHRVTIQKSVSLKNEYSESVNDWQNVVQNIYARVTNRTGREDNDSDQINSFVSVSVRIRKRSGIKPDMRLVHRERILKIIAVLPTQDLAYIDLQCEAWVNE